MKNNLVVKANKLNESRYRLTVHEQRVILTMLSLIKQGDSDFNPYSFTVKDFASLVGITGKDIYDRIKKVTKSLVGRRITIKESDGDLHVSWLSSAKYHDGQGCVELSFDPKLKPYLLALKQEFTRYQLKNTIRLRSVYSVRFYELLKQYQSVGSRYFDLDELRSLLGISDTTFKLYGHFKARVIEKAKAELKNTDISFTYEPVKTVRRVTGINFFIKQNAPVVKKSYKRKANPLVVKSPLAAVKDSVQDLENNLLNGKLDLLRVQYPKHYETLLKQAEKRLSGKEKEKPGLKLTLRFKMLDLLSGFIQKNKIKL